LPDFWQHVSMLNPILYMVNAFRFGILGISDVNVYAALLMLLAFTVALGAWGYWLLLRGVGLRK
jgi:ABC-2 type transport system permease protein